MTSPAAKAEWRASLLAARRARTPADRDAARGELAARLPAILADWHGSSRIPLTICTYLPLPSEPLPPTLAESLLGQGFRVLAPVTITGEPLDWCALAPGYRARLASGPFGIGEPSGRRLGPKAIRQADVVLVPALAVDRSGFRLGRGGGFYDRSLALLDGRLDRLGGTRTVAVVFDDEVGVPIPHEAHDVPVTHAVTPSTGLVTFASGEVRAPVLRPEGPAEHY